MGLIESKRDGQVLLARLAHGKANALNRAVLKELRSLLQQVAGDDDIRALVLGSSVPNFFSAGFDVVEVFSYSADEMRSFFELFIDVYEGLQKLPKGIVAAISGHAYAGGAILALACDWKIMADGPYGFALNEVNVGISLPIGISRMVVNLLGTGYSRQLFLSGDPVSPGEAFRIGLVNKIVPEDEVFEQAVRCARTLAEKPPAAFAAIKGKILQVTGLGDSSDRHELDNFMARWETVEARTARQKLLESLKG